MTCQFVVIIYNGYNTTQKTGRDKMTDLNIYNNNLSINKPEIGNLTIIAGSDSGDLNKTIKQVCVDFQEQNKPCHLINADRKFPFMFDFRLLPLILETASVLPGSASLPGSVPLAVAGLAGLGLLISTQDNLEFVKNLDLISHNQSYIATEYPEIIEQLHDLMGGNLSYNKHTGVIFHKNNPDGSVKDMPIYLASSVVRNLAYIYFYLQHQIKTGEILLIEEPELSLHPEQQVKMARILAILVNAGIRMVITSHSDYMIREFNALIALGSMSRLPTKKQKKSYRVLHYIDNSMLLSCNKHDINIYGLTNGYLSDKFTVNRHGLNLNTFDQVMNNQSRLFSITDRFVSSDINTT